MGHPAGSVSMGLLDRYRKRRAIRAFSKRLGPALSERFGHTSHYTADQIGDVVGSGKLRRHREFLAYAYCLFMSRKDFEALDTDVGASGDFESLRIEAFQFIGPGSGAVQPGPGAWGDASAGPSPGDFDAGDGGSGL
jgi:hypothetical protein